MCRGEINYISEILISEDESCIFSGDVQELSSFVERARGLKCGVISGLEPEVALQSSFFMPVHESPFGCNSNGS